MKKFRALSRGMIVILIAASSLYPLPVQAKPTAITADLAAPVESDVEAALKVPVLPPTETSSTESDLILVVPEETSPIEYQPFTKEELGNPGDTVTITQNDAETKELTLDEFLKSLNRLEKSLNQYGHSLRTDSGEVHLLTLKSQSVETPSAVTFPISDKTVQLNIPSTTGSATQAEADESDNQEGPDLPPPATVYTQFSPEMDKWGVEYGDKDILKFESYVDMTGSGYKNGISVESEHETNLWVLGNKLTLAGFHGKGSIATAQDGSGRIGSHDLEILGDKIIDATYPYSNSNNYDGAEMSGSKSKSVEKSKSMTFVVGVVPIEVKLKLKGTVKYSYSQDYLSGGLQQKMKYVDIHAKPEVDVDLTGSATVDAVVAEAKLVADVQLLDLYFDFHSELDLLGASGCDGCLYAPYGYQNEFSGTYNWSVLDGELYIKLIVHNPFGKNPTYKISLAEWEGLKGEGTLFKYTDNASYEE